MADEIVGSAKIRVELDDSGVERQARQTGRKLRDGFKGSGTDAADGFVRDAQGRLRDSRGRFAREGEALGRGLGTGFGTGVRRGASVAAEALEESAEALALLVAGTGAVTGLGIALAATAQAAVGLSAALAPSVGIVAALPAGVLLLGAAAGSLRVALLGVSDAFEAALSGDAEEFGEALAVMAPQAARVAIELRRLRPELGELRRNVQGAFFEPLVGDLRRLSRVLGGPLNSGLSITAAQLGQLAAAVTGFAASARGVRLVDEVFFSLQQTLAAIRPESVDRLLEAVSFFVATSLPAFDGLGPALEGGLVRISEFLESAASSGDAMAWINDAVAVFRQLGQVVFDLGGILGGVFDAAEAGGQNALGVITELLDEVHEFVDSTQGQSALIRTFEALSELGSQLGPVIGTLVTQLGRVGPIVVDLADDVGSILTAALEAVGDTLVELGPGLLAVFAAVDEAISRVSESQALAELGAGASDLLEALAPLIPAAVEFALVLAEMVPAVSGLAGVLTPLVALVGGVAAVFGALPGPLQAALVALTALVLMRGRVQAFGEVLSQLPQRLSSQAVGAATRSMSTLRSGLSGLLGLVGGPWGVAIAAGVTAISLFGSQQEKAARKVEGLTATLDAQTGAITENTRYWIATELQQRGVLQQAARLGIDTAVLTRAVLGEAGAMRQLTEALDENFDKARKREGAGLPDALAGEVSATGQLKEAVDELSVVYQGAAEAARLKADAARDDQEAGSGAATTTLLQVEAARKLTLAEQAAASAVRSVTAAMKEQADLLRAQVDPAFAFQQALQGVAEKQKAYSDAVKESGSNSRDARLAALELATASADLGTAASNLGDAFTGRLTPNMRETLRAAGLTKGEIQAVERSLKDTKKAAESYEGKYKADVTVEGATAAERKIRNLNRVIADIERSVTIGITANVTGLNRLPAFGANADGGIITHPMISLLGEGYKPEVVIPLTKPARARQLAEASGLTRILAAAAPAPTAAPLAAAAVRVTAARVTGTGGLPARLARDVVDGFLIQLRALTRAVYAGSARVFEAAVQGAEDVLGIASPSKVLARIGRETGKGFIKGLTGTLSEIKQTAKDIIGSIREAFRGRNTRLDDRLVATVREGNRRLRRLAAERDQLAERIAEARRMATDTAERALSAFSLQNLARQDGSAAGLLAGLDDAVDRVRDFTRKINALARRGLHRNLIEQLLGLGPEAGAELARTLSEADRDTLRRINTLQSQLVGASTDLGRAGADAMFDAGRQAGRGFLAGLQGQRKQIEKLMLDIARGMQRAIRTALRISSPSKVMMWLGDQTGAGLQAGLIARMGALARESRQAARKVVAAVTSELGAMAAPRELPQWPLERPPAGRGRVLPLTAARPERPGWWPPPDTAGAPAAREIHNHFTINEVGDGEATANRVLTRLAFAAGGL